MEMIGFYREMDPENDAVFREPIGDKVRDRTPYPKAEIKRYLDSGHPIFDIMESTIDVVEGAFRVPGGSSLLSDGRFVWRVDLAAHVERYHLELPANSSSMPATTDSRCLLRICRPCAPSPRLRRAPWGSAWSADRLGVAAHPLELRHVLEAFGELP
ncbi:hypothetical protein OG818_13680 [Streptomyces virginiae]|uniref:hypothetical protein n=1 Tax=Streptomyces virginiae TaxID=1961 RepID=UPI00224CFA9C|nr:hypothetical protein [Streptomyces virginiae]MCX4716853.1 hypothetical protein [Streptomyces virginiae]